MGDESPPPPSAYRTKKNVTNLELLYLHQLKGPGRLTLESGTGHVSSGEQPGRSGSGTKTTPSDADARMSVFQGDEAATEAGGRLGSRGAEKIQCYHAMAPQRSRGPRAGRHRHYLSLSALYFPPWHTASLCLGNNLYLGPEFG